MDAGRQLAALADPTRRAIFESLAKQPRAVGALAIEHPVSRPAVSQHLKVLATAGLVEARSVGTQRIYSVKPGGLEALRQWVESTWDQALDHFEAAARKESQ